MKAARGRRRRVFIHAPFTQSFWACHSPGARWPLPLLYCLCPPVPGHSFAISHPLVYKGNMNICIMSYSLPGTFPSITLHTSPSSLHAFHNHHHPHFTDVLHPQERQGWRSLGLGGVPTGSCGLHHSLGARAL